MALKKGAYTGQRSDIFGSCLRDGKVVQVEQRSGSVFDLSALPELYVVYMCTVSCQSLLPYNFFLHYCKL